MRMAGNTVIATTRSGVVGESWDSVSRPVAAMSPRRTRMAISIANSANQTRSPIEKSLAISSTGAPLLFDVKVRPALELSGAPLDAVCANGDRSSQFRCRGGDAEHLRVRVSSVVRHAQE